MKCPRCGSLMQYRKETESFERKRKSIQTYYKCPVCGYRVNEQQITLNGVNGTIRVSVRVAIEVFKPR